MFNITNVVNTFPLCQLLSIYVQINTTLEHCTFSYLLFTSFCCSIRSSLGRKHKYIIGQVCYGRGVSFTIRGTSPGLKWLEHVVYYSPPSNAEVNEWSYTSTLCIGFMAWTRTTLGVTFFTVISFRSPGITQSIFLYINVPPTQ